jgi:hypothetical protein
MFPLRDIIHGVAIRSRDIIYGRPNELRGSHAAFPLRRWGSSVGSIERRIFVPLRRRAGSSLAGKCLYLLLLQLYCFVYLLQPVCILFLLSLSASVSVTAVRKPNLPRNGA